MGFFLFGKVGFFKGYKVVSYWVVIDMFDVFGVILVYECVVVDCN